MIGAMQNFAAWLAAASRSASRPSRTPRTFAAWSAAFVRETIISRSCSATAARICRVSRVAWGLSQATNSTPASVMAAMNATLRDRLIQFRNDEAGLVLSAGRQGLL